MFYVVLLYYLYLFWIIITMSQYGLKTFLIKIKSSELLHIYFIAIKLLLYDSHGLMSIFIWSEMKRY